MKRKTLALWSCVAYFAFLIAGFAFHTLWGGLGLLRPDMIEDGKIAVGTATNLINHFQGLFRLLYGLLIVGFVLLVTVTVKMSKKEEGA
jgi:hypothetical protein